jgi:hypothetical protein
LKECSEGAGRRGEEPTPSQASRPDQKQAPHQRGEGIRGVPPPEQKIVYTQEHYDRDEKEKYVLLDKRIARIDDDGEKWKTLGWNRFLLKRIGEIERRQKRYLREQEKKERAT